MPDRTPDLPYEDFEAPEGIEEPEHPEHVPLPPDVPTQDPEATR